MNTTVKYIAGFILTVLALFLVWYFRVIVAYILISAVLALIGKPLVRFFCKPVYKRLRLPRAAGAAITLFLIWALILGFITLFVPVVITESQNLSRINTSELFAQFEGPLDRLQQVLAGWTGPVFNGLQVKDFLLKSAAKLFNMRYISTFFTSFAGFLGNSVVAFFSVTFITFFFLRDENLVHNAFFALIPEKYSEQASRALNSINRLLLRYFVGLIIEVTGVSALVTAGMLAVGLSITQSLLVGLFAGVLNMIPYVGPIIGTVFGLFIGAVTQLQTGTTDTMLVFLLWMLVVFVSVQVIDNLLLQPVIYSSSVHAHPLEIFLVILVAGSLAGITGMVVAVPSYIVLRVFAKEFLAHFRIVQKLTRNL